MATQVGPSAYCPAIEAEFRWDDEVGEMGGWRITLLHDILLCHQDDPRTAVLLPSGCDLEMDLGEGRSTVLLPGPGTSFPPNVAVDTGRDSRPVSLVEHKESKIPF